MTASFPLLNLPTKAISDVLKSMNINEFITLSFLSKRAKLSVEAMELKSPNVIVQIDEFVNIFMPLGENIWRWSFHGDETENGTMNRALPNKLTELCIHHGPIEWSMEDLSVKKWISHFQTIFHFSKFNSLQLSTASFLYDIEEIKATIGNFETLNLSITGTNNEGYDLLVKYFVSRCLILDSGVFECLERPKEVLIQNYDELEITSVSGVYIILDDLLMMNSKTVMLGYINWTGKEINRFIKHWMKGSNPRLETLEIFLASRVFNRTDALNGIRYMEIPTDHVRNFKTFDLVNLDIEGGYDFQRSDGTTATITFYYDEESVLLQIDHAHSTSHRPSPSSCLLVLIPSTVLTTSFPLLNLPTKAISHVLKSMNINEFITISFLSKRAKLSVEAMELKSRGVLVQIGDLVNIVVPVGESYWRWSFHGDETENGTLNRALPDKFTELSIHHGPIEWSMEDLSVKKWISHFKTIFHFSKFYSLQFYTDSLMYDIEEIKATFGNFDKLLISIDNSTSEAYDLLVKHFPSRSLLFDGGVFECLEHPKKVLIQNYDELEITLDIDSDEGVLILDDILMVNSKTVVLGDVNWTGKEVNRFIKHWIKGSNPRLETLEIFSTSRGEASDRTVALKGIRYKEIPANLVRKFKTLHQESLDVEGGYDIIRHDGTTATVTFDYDEEFDTDSFFMFVWHPHCVGDS